MNLSIKVAHDKWSNLMLDSIIYERGYEGQKGNSAVKIEGGGGQWLYLYIVKIGNIPEILMPSLSDKSIRENWPESCTVKNVIGRLAFLKYSFCLHYFIREACYQSIHMNTH